MRGRGKRNIACLEEVREKRELFTKSSQESAHLGGTFGQKEKGGQMHME